MQRGDDAVRRVIEDTGLTPATAPNSKSCVTLKNGSYWRTGLPLLLKIVQPLLIQRGVMTGPPGATGPGSAWLFFWTSRPKPSE